MDTTGVVVALVIPVMSAGLSVLAFAWLLMEVAGRGSPVLAIGLGGFVLFGLVALVGLVTGCADRAAERED